MIAGGEELPPYFDPHYGCQMEVLEYDSRFPNPKYRDKVVELSACLAQAPLVCHDRLVTAMPGIYRPREIQTETTGVHNSLAAIA